MSDGTTATAVPPIEAAPVKEPLTQDQILQYLLEETIGCFAQWGTHLSPEQISQIHGLEDALLVSGQVILGSTDPVGRQHFDISALPTSTVFADKGSRHTNPVTDGTSFVDGQNGRLMYRDLYIDEIAKLPYEVVIHYMQTGELPTPENAEQIMRERSAEFRERASLPAEVIGLVEMLDPQKFPPMKILQSTSALLQCDHDPLAAMVKLPLLVGLINQRVEGETDVELYQEPAENKQGYFSIVEHFCRTAFGQEFAQKPAEEQNELIGLMEKLFILHMIHGAGNASTFAASIVGGTQADVDAAMSAAVGALSGRLHGGANEKALLNLAEIKECVNHTSIKYRYEVDGQEVTLDALDKSMRDNYKGLVFQGDDPVFDNNGQLIPGREALMKERVKNWLNVKLELKERLFGLGHRVYKKKDPRATAIQADIETYFTQPGRQKPEFYVLAEALEEHAGAVEKFQGKINPNVDFFSGIVYKKALSLKPEMMTLLFAAARSVGWALRWEQQYKQGLVRHAPGPAPEGSIPGELPQRQDPEQWEEKVLYLHQLRQGMVMAA